jgi:hypothetical protein
MKARSELVVEGGVVVHRPVDGEVNHPGVYVKVGGGYMEVVPAHPWKSLGLKILCQTDDYGIAKTLAWQHSRKMFADRDYTGAGK